VTFSPAYLYPLNCHSSEFSLLDLNQPFHCCSSGLSTRYSLLTARCRSSELSLHPLCCPLLSLMALFHCMVRQGTVQYGSLLGGFPLVQYLVLFSTTLAGVPSDPYHYPNVTCKLYWSLIGLRKSSLLRHWTCDIRPNIYLLDLAQPAKDRKQLLFEQTHFFVSTIKCLFRCLLWKYRRW